VGKYLYSFSYPSQLGGTTQIKQRYTGICGPPNECRNFHLRRGQSVAGQLRSSAWVHTAPPALSAFRRKCPIRPQAGRGDDLRNGDSRGLANQTNAFFADRRWTATRFGMTCGNDADHLCDSSARTAGRTVIPPKRNRRFNVPMTPRCTRSATSSNVSSTDSNSSGASQHDTTAARKLHGVPSPPA
jgi:hypothetical protein